MALESIPFIRAGSASKQGWILVLAREPRLRQLLLTVLSWAGYALLGCATLAQAGPLLSQRSAPRLILFDGAAASEATLREHLHQLEGFLPPGARCRVLVFSLAHPLPRLQALAGVDALIARPFDLSQVLDQVDALMQAP